MPHTEKGKGWELCVGLTEKTTVPKSSREPSRIYGRGQDTVVAPVNKEQKQEQQQ
jgi:hypothetical protein